MANPEKEERALVALEALCPAIASIDGGCYVCIDKFLEDANRDLAAAGVRWEFFRPDDWGEDRSVVLRPVP